MKLQEKILKRQFPLQLQPIKYLGIKLTRDVKGLYTENYNALLKEIGKDTMKWEDIPCSWIGRTDIFKMFVLHKAIHRFNAIPHQNPNDIF